MITIIDPGTFTTIQDRGRWGYQAFGMPVAGAMDQYAYGVANLLAGNEAHAAVIEMTGRGAAFKFDAEQLVAVCGADMQGKINGDPIPTWASFFVPRRGELVFDTAVTGYRTYVAVRGGFSVAPILGSRSTYTRAKLGGYEGRTLRLGDVLYIGTDVGAAGHVQSVPKKYIPSYPAKVHLRVLLGPQDTMFTRAVIDKFFASTYTVGSQSDRTGYQLKGPKIITIGREADIVSDAAGLGAIQIPSSGNPIIVTADHETTRGFAKIGYVIRADLARLAQAKPGDKIRFTCVAEEDAVAMLKEERKKYEDIKIACKGTFQEN